MFTEPFANGNSWIHRIDPRKRIVSAAVFSVLVAVSWNVMSLVAGACFALSLVFLARMNLRRTMERLMVVLGFLTLLWLILPWTIEGDPVWAAGPFSASHEGVMLAVRITLKAVAILMVLMALINTMTVATLGHALGRLKIPDKIVHLLMITYRYIFVIEQEFQRLLRAAKVRGFVPRSNVHTYRTFAYLIGMLFIRAWERGHRVDAAMRCRGFKGRFHTLQMDGAESGDWVFGVFMSAALCIVAGLEWLLIV